MTLVCLYKVFLHWFPEAEFWRFLWHDCDLFSTSYELLLRQIWWLSYAGLLPQPYGRGDQVLWNSAQGMQTFIWSFYGDFCQFCGDLCPLLWRSAYKPSWSLNVIYISVSWLLGMVLSDRASIKSTIYAQSDCMMPHCLKGRYVAFCKLCEHNSIIIAYFAII